ncbi:citrate synthase [Variovorax sp. J31P179]|nr:citrate synthase [Variovorax sp. J31P179]MDM0084660.1 citrate synthase [Variovorax sp. J31P179]
MDALLHARVPTAAGATATAEGTIEQEAGRGDYVDSKEAMKLLGIRQQTLYAYVSRGLIASMRQADRKDHLYLRADVERMVLRSLARTGHGALAASAMNWGEPIVPTTITEITPLGPRYRGHLAADLARRRSGFESVAELLWSGLLDDHPVTWAGPAPAAPLMRLTRALATAGAADQLHEIFSLVTLQMGVSTGSESRTSAFHEECPEEPNSFDAARAVIRTLAGCMGYAGPAQGFVPLQGRAWWRACCKRWACQPRTRTPKRWRPCSSCWPTMSSHPAPCVRGSAPPAAVHFIAAWPRGCVPSAERTLVATFSVWTNFSMARPTFRCCWRAPPTANVAALWYRASCTPSTRAAIRAGDTCWPCCSVGRRSPPPHERC